MAKSWLEIVGYNSRYILFFTNIIVLTFFGQINYTIFYLILFYLDDYINCGLKIAIKQPRPNGSNTISDGGDYTALCHKYGMPSGHAETTFMSLAFLYNTVKFYPALIFEFAVCLITLYQRYVFKKHTPLQLLFGSIVGCIVGYGGVFLYKKYYPKLVEYIRKYDSVGFTKL